MEENLDDKIKKLNKVLTGLKKERKKSEKEEILFNKRYKVLRIERELKEIKRKNELKLLEKKQKVRTSISYDKNKLKEKKLNDKQNIEEKKIKNFFQKNNINKSLQFGKRNFSEKNKREFDKIKQEKISIQKQIKDMNDKNLNQNKQIHDNVRLNIFRLEEKKENEIMEKNLILKNELTKQIEKEIANLGKINKFAKNEEEINNILKMYSNINKSNKNNDKNL